jgi:arsenical pump membrane protein
VYACTHLANSASLLLPVSNLTNLLAFSASGLTFVRFAGLMTLPWLAVIAVEYLILRRFFAADLATPADPVEPPAEKAPTAAIVIVALTLIAFGVTEPLGIAPAWVALAGAVAMAVRNRERRPLTLLKAANPGFCLFVFALGIVVLAVSRSGVGGLIDRLVPERPDLLGLLAIAALAAVLANLVNNLPATLMLVPLAAHSPGLILAVLLGVNIGPNLTYVGSLATLLWRQILHGHGQAPTTREFLRLGLLSVPVCILAGVAALWLGLRISVL